MKKIIATILALAMAAAMSVTAFAAEGDTNVTESTPGKSGSTAVHFRVNPTYTVTIPADVSLSLDEATSTYTGNGTISADAVRLGKDQVITVKLSGNFVLESAEGATLNYKVKIDGHNDALADLGTVAEFVTSTSTQSVQLNYSAENPVFAGIYRDTLIFTIYAPEISDHVTED